MRTNRHVRQSLFMLIAIILLIAHCGKPGKLTEADKKKMAAQLFDSFRKTLPGSELKTDLENCLVEPAEKNRYWITFKDISFTTDLTSVIKLLGNSMVQEEQPLFNLKTVYIDEVLFLYEPKTKYSQLKHIKGLNFDFDFSVPGREKQEMMLFGFYIKRGHASVGNFTVNDLNIADLIESGKPINEQIPKKSLLTDSLVSDSFENIKVEFRGLTREKEDLLILLETGKFEAIKKGVEEDDAWTYIWGNDVPAPDLGKILQKGLALSDMEWKVGRTTISMKKSGKQWAKGSLDSFSYLFYVKPSESRNHFEFGVSFILKNLELVCPEKKQLERVSNLKELRLAISFEHLNPGVVLAFLNIMKNSIQLRDSANEQNVRQVMMMQTFAFVNEVINSKPLIKISISPFKHNLGELSAEANIRIFSLFTPPDLNARVDIFQIDKFLKNIEEANLFSSSTMKSIEETVKKFIVKHQNGDASINIEMKPDQPGVYFLNGKALKKHSK